MTKARVLVVDDEPQIQRFLKPSLTASGYEVVQATTGADALESFSLHAPSLVLLDLGLPDMDGKDVLGAIRALSQVPVIVLSARDGEVEKILALDLGATDYVSKPFGIGELLARIRGVLRRSPQLDGDPDRIEAPPIAMDLRARRVTVRGDVVRLTPKEFDLLALLARHSGRVLTHRQILADIWGPAHTEDTQYLRVLVGQLRRKIEQDVSTPALLTTDAGIGYRLISPGDFDA